MAIIYPRSPDECPSYLNCGGNDWRDEVRVANNFGKQSEYNIDDEVETMSFYFADSQSHKQNQVIIEKGIVEKINVYKEITKFIYVKCNYYIKITNEEYLRPA